MSNGRAIDALLIRLETLPDGVRDEVRAAMVTCLDVAGAGVVEMLSVAARHDLVDELIAGPDAAALLAWCGIEPDVVTPVAVGLSSRPRCELCARSMGTDHDHAADVTDRRLLCVCRPCALALHGAGRYRTLPDRAAPVADLEEPPTWWRDLAIPVELAFFVAASGTGTVTGFYPGSAGVVESDRDVGPLPVELVPDVEALLVRDHGRFQAWRVPVDRCYELAGLLRHASRGAPPAEATRSFFDRLAHEAGGYR